MARRGTLARLAFVAILLASALTIHGQTTLTFSNTPLLRPDGDSEPAISIGTTGTMAISGLSWNKKVGDPIVGRAAPRATPPSTTPRGRSSRTPSPTTSTTSTRPVKRASRSVYLSQSVANGSFSQSKVSNTPNHVGVVCLEGAACVAGTRNLLDLFEVALDPLSNKAAVIYTDDTISQTTSGTPLPQIVLATQQ